MKTIYSILCIAILAIACDSKKENMAEEKPVNDAFEKNSKVVKAALDAFENENFDYSIYADDLIIRGTGFGEQDTITLAEMKTSNQEMWKMFDFKFVSDSLNLLSSVNADTKMPDGSVRYYGDWKVTRAATDSTEEKSGVLKMYHSFDFDEDGKINFEQSYGDFTGLMMYLTSPAEMGKMMQSEK